MATSYPSGLDSFTNPTATDETDDEIGTRTHSEFHADNNDAIEAIQAELGTTPKGAAANVGARILATETVANAALPTATAATTYQPLDTDLTAIAALTSAADKVPYSTGAGTWALADFSAFGRTLIDDADASTARSTLGLVIGTNVQAYDGDLAAIAGLTSAADALPYFTGSGTAAVTTLTAAARTVLDDTTVGAMLATMGGVAISGTSSGAQVVLQTGTATHVPLVAKGTAAQSGNLQEWQNSSGTVLASVASDGRSLWASGGSGAPGVSFASDTDTGLYSIGADVLGVAVGGGERIRVTTTAVGIGGLTPTAQLHVFGTGQETAAFTDAGATGATLYLQSVEGNFNSGGAVLFGAGVDKFAAIKSLYQDGTGNGLGNLAISTRAGTADTALTERLTVTWDGLVTIVGSTSRLKFGHADQAQTTVGAAGGASALPATPTKYFKVKDSGGTEYVIPAYAAA